MSEKNWSKKERKNEKVRKRKKSYFMTLVDQRL